MTDRRARLFALWLAGALFLLCGLSTVLNDVLLPYLHRLLGLDYASMAEIQTSFYVAYFLLSPLAAYYFDGDYRAAMRCGLLTGAVGTLVIGLTSSSAAFVTILCGVFILGSGIAMIQVGANPYVVRLGDLSHSAVRLSITQSCTSVGTILAPLLGARYILSTFVKASGDPPATMGVVYPLLVSYWSLGALWMGLFLLTHYLPDRRGTPAPDSTGDGVHPLQDPVVQRGILAIALAVGVEVSVGSFLVSFLQEKTILGAELKAAGMLSALFWAGFMLGRLWGAALLKSLSAPVVLFRHTIAAVVLSVVAATFQGTIAAAAILGLGLCTSVLFPVIFSHVLTTCRASCCRVSGFLCMANIGGALVPLTQGFVADSVGLQPSFFVPVFGYLLLTVYARYELSSTCLLAPDVV